MRLVSTLPYTPKEESVQKNFSLPVWIYIRVNCVLAQEPFSFSVGRARKSLIVIIVSRIQIQLYIEFQLRFSWTVICSVVSLETIRSQIEELWLETKRCGVRLLVIIHWHNWVLIVCSLIIIYRQKSRETSRALRSTVVGPWSISYIYWERVRKQITDLSPVWVQGIHITFVCSVLHILRK